MVVRTRGLLLAVAFLLAVVACSPAGTSPTPSAASTSVAVASPTIAPSPVAPSARPSDDGGRSPGPTAPTSPTAARIATLEAAIAAKPDDATSQRDLGFALLQRIRETADPSLYAP